jgi:hypothetical protein
LDGAGGVSLTSRCHATIHSSPSEPYTSNTAGQPQCCTTHKEQPQCKQHSATWQANSSYKRTECHANIEGQVPPYVHLHSPTGETCTQ